MARFGLGQEAPNAALATPLLDRQRGCHKTVTERARTRRQATARRADRETKTQGVKTHEMLKELMVHRGWMTRPELLHVESPPRYTEDRVRDYAEALHALHFKPTLH
jgi:hypothetical protein